MRDHRKTVNALAISSDGRTMLSGSNDRSARFWDLATMQQVGPALAHKAMVLAVAFSPDGKSYATASYDRSVRFGTIASREPARIGRASGSRSHRSTSLVIPCGSRRVAMMARFAFGMSKRESPCKPTPPMAIASNRSSSSEMTWLLRRVQAEPFTSGTRSRAKRSTSSRDTRHASGPSPFLATVRLLASGGLDGTVRLWDLNDLDNPPRTLEGHAESVRSIAFCPDGRTLASGSDDKTIKLWDIATGEPKTILRRATNIAFGLSVSLRTASSFSPRAYLIRIWRAPRDDAGPIVPTDARGNDAP